MLNYGTGGGERLAIPRVARRLGGAAAVPTGACAEELIRASFVQNLGASLGRGLGDERLEVCKSWNSARGGGCW